MTVVSFNFFRHCPQISLATTRTISSMCPKCGIIAKSGRASCCGRGGSWFGNCGAAGKEKLDHNWSEGFQACKSRSQSKTVIGQQLHGADHKSNGVSDDTDDRVNAEAVITAANTFTFAVDNMSTPMQGKTPVILSANILVSESIDTSASVTDPAYTIASVPEGCAHSWNAGLHISILVVVVLIS